MATIALNIIFLTILWVAAVLELGYKKNSTSVNFTIVFTVVLTVGSFITIFWLFDWMLERDPTFGAGPLGACLILLVEQYYENFVGYLLRLLPTYSLLLLLLGGSIVTYTALGLLIFNPNSSEYQQYFGSFGTAVWNMLMVLNGSNWPSPMIPAFNQNSSFCLYFFIYIIIFGWGLLNLITGYIYGFFQEEQMRMSKSNQALLRKSMIRAFRLLDTNQYGILTFPQVDALLQELYTFYLNAGTVPTTEERLELILLLDSKAEGWITLENFVENLQAKCFSSALYSMRAKKGMFFRYWNVANINRHASIDKSQHGQSIRGSIERISYAISFSNRGDTDNTEQTISPASLAETQEKLAIEAGVYGKIEDPRLVQLYRQQTLDGTRGIDPNSDETATETANRPVTAADSWYEMFRKSFELFGSQIAIRVDSIDFDIGVDTILLVLAIVFFCLETPAVYVTYLTVSLFGCMCKVLSKGTFRFVRSRRNSVDALTAAVLLIITISLSAQYPPVLNGNAFSRNFSIRCSNDIIWLELFYIYMMK